MEKLLAINLNNNELEQINRICSQMKIRLIQVQKNQMLVPLDNLLDQPAYKATDNILLTQDMNQNKVEEKSLVIMCDLSDKHVDKLLASLRMCQINVCHKAVLTQVNRKWNALRMLAEMDLERRSYEQRK